MAIRFDSAGTPTWRRERPRIPDGPGWLALVILVMIVAVLVVRSIAGGR